MRDTPDRGEQRQHGDGVEQDEPHDGREPVRGAAVLAERESAAVVVAALVQAPAAHDERHVRDCLDPRSQEAKVAVTPDREGRGYSGALDGAEVVGVG